MPRSCILLSLGALTLFADDFSDRAKINGAWEVTGSDKDAGMVWRMEQKGDSIRITESHNDRQVSQLDCKIGGECQVKGGHSKFMLWFNGAKLVEMETRGSEVIKRRFSASDDAMEMEVIPIVPEGKPQIVKLKRTKPGAGQ